MGWLGRLFRAVLKEEAVPEEEMNGICLDHTLPYWEVYGLRTFTELFHVLRGWLPEGSVIYLEGGLPDTEINDFIATYSIPEQTHVAMGTIWPRPKVFHVPATEAILTELAGIMDHHAEHELANHFHVYCANTVLLEWHDAFYQPMLISGSIPEEQIKLFADKVGKKHCGSEVYRIVEPEDE